MPDPYQRRVNRKLEIIVACSRKREETSEKWRKLTDRYFRPKSLSALRKNKNGAATTWQPQDD